MDDLEVLSETTKVDLEHNDTWGYSVTGDAEFLWINYYEYIDNVKVIIDSFDVPIFCAAQIADVMKRLATQYTK